MIETVDAMRAADLAGAEAEDRTRLPIPIAVVAERMRGRLELAQERRRQQVVQERATFTGTCFICRDAGMCQYCARGRTEMRTQYIAARRAEVTTWLIGGGLSPRQAEYTFDTFPVQQPMVDAMRVFAREWDEHAWVYLHGPYGTGKTGLIASALGAVAARCLQNQRSMRYVTSTTLYQELKREHDFDRTPYERAGLLVIDDLGAARQTEWANGELFAIVNERHEHNRATWFTSNYALDAIAPFIGERTMWRILERVRHTMLEVRGPNLREHSYAE